MAPNYTDSEVMAIFMAGAAAARGQARGHILGAHADVRHARRGEEERAAQPAKCRAKSAARLSARGIELDLYRGGGELREPPADLPEVGAVADGVVFERRDDKAK